MSKIVAGLVAGIPLSVIGIVYMLVGGQRMISALMDSDASFAEFPDGALFWLFLGTFALAPLVFGALSGVVYGWIGSPLWFLDSLRTLTFLVGIIINERFHLRERLKLSHGQAIVLFLLLSWISAMAFELTLADEQDPAGGILLLRASI